MFSSKRIMTYFITSCVSYTACSLILTLLSIIFEDFSPSIYHNLEYFVVCLSISVLMFFTDMFTDSCTAPIAVLIQITDVIVCVLGIGGLIFHWFPFKPFWLLIVLGIILLIYFITFAVMYYVNRKWVNNVNKILTERKSEKNNG